MSENDQQFLAILQEKKIITLYRDFNGGSDTRKTCLKLFYVENC